MAFFHQNSITKLSPNFNEEQWVEQVRQTLMEEMEEDTDFPVTIFAVPKQLKDIHPNSYTPHQVAIGPYHHLQRGLYDMERYKVSAARRSQKEFQDLNLELFVEHLIQFDVRIRACYHRPLNYAKETLAWMMAIDTCFLFDFFQVSGVKKGRVLNKVSSRLSQLIDLSGNRITHNDILRDIMMLENQIPLFVMRMLLEFQFSSTDLADETLLDMLMRLSRELSPFKMGKLTRTLDVRDCPHILAFLYQFIVPKSEVASEIIIEIIEEEEENELEDSDSDSFTKPSQLGQAADMLCQMFLSIGEVKRVIFSKPMELLSKLPWTIISRIPILKVFKGPIERMFNNLGPDCNGDDEDDENHNIPKPPLLEEITIPCVTELSQVGVKFVPTNGGITTINFDRKTLTLSIPKILLDVNSEVVLRNLVAFEACTASGPLVLTRYTELMNGIIDTEMDVRILCRRGIIVNHLKSEKEVLDLWNGMSKSIRLTKVPSLDKMIADVNEFYDGRLKVKCRNFMKRYVFGSWKILTFLGAILLMLLMSLQAFCQVYSCASVFRIQGLQPNLPNVDHNNLGN